MNTEMKELENVKDVVSLALMAEGWSFFAKVVVLCLVFFVLTIGKPDIIDGIVYKLTGVKAWEDIYNQDLKQCKTDLEEARVLMLRKK